MLKCRFRGFMVFLLLAAFIPSAGHAIDEGGTMGSPDLDDYQDEDATTEDRTLAPNEYSDSESSGDDVVVEEEIPIVGSDE